MCDAERDHEARQIGAAQDEETGGEAEEPRDEGRGDEAEQRIGRDLQCEQPGRIGAGAEKGGVAERHDAGEAEDEIERQREQRENGDLVEQQRRPGQYEGRAECRDPEQDFGPSPATVGGETRGEAVGERSRGRR